MEAALVRVNLDDDDRENCVVLRVKRRKMQLSTRDCRRTYKFFVCQLNGISLSLSLSLYVCMCVYAPFPGNLLNFTVALLCDGYKYGTRCC